MERDAITMQVARNIEALMAARGMDAAKLARAAGLNPTGIYDILKGKSRSPKIETIGKIAVALGVPVALVFSDDVEASLRDDIARVFEQLPPEKQELLIQTARAWVADPAA